ncbi:protein kinase domain-containing protein [Streptomyces lavendulocolor]|uniref:serine/threonine-protein kinase n=1 Tax=Streptomyces lavendulocolor TaxID=67316 RepID=UPI003C309043
MKPGEVLDDRYRLLGVLGRGGFGTVWKAFDERLQRQVALKIMFRPAAEAGWNKAVARFWQEAITAGGLSSEHIVVVHDFGRAKHGDTPHDYLVMELLEGRPLSQIVSAGAVPIHQAISWSEQICMALEAAHRAGVIHRDIKPQNIVVNEDTSRLKVVDFGIAKNTALPLSLTETGTVIGSVLYMAPERADLRSIVDERSDLYSLGCVLYELLTGSPPFYDPDATPAAIVHCHAHQAPLPPSSTRHGVPVDLDRLVLELLAKDPARRPVKAAEVRQRLAAVVPGPGIPCGALQVARQVGSEERALSQRIQAAVKAGEHGRVLRARNLLQDIYRESQQMLGANHACTILARLEWVRLHGEIDPDRGYAAAVALQADCDQALGPVHRLTLRCRSVLGYLTDETSRPDRARVLLASVIEDCDAYLGLEAAETLEARLWHTAAACCTEDHAEALVLSSQLLRDCERILGPVHRLTLDARLKYALSVSNTSGMAAGQGLHTAAITDATAQFGEDSSLVLLSKLAWLAADDVEDISLPRVKYETELLLPGVLRSYGDAAMTTFVTRALIATASAYEDAGIALHQLASLIIHSSAALGPRTTTTLWLRRIHANLSGSGGDVGKARDLLRELLVDMENVLGADARVVGEVREEAERWASAAPRRSRMPRPPSWFKGFR